MVKRLTVRQLDHLIVYKLRQNKMTPLEMIKQLQKEFVREYP